MTTHTMLETPLGEMAVVVEDGAPVWIGWLDEADAGAGHPRHPDLGARDDDEPVGAAVRAQLAEYFAGTRTRFELPEPPRVGTPFQEAVWAELRTIPYGQTRTYGRLAAALGAPGATRAVGTANGRNRLTIVVPCHRVVPATGGTGGYAGGTERKAWLLAHEQRVSGQARG